MKNDIQFHQAEWVLTGRSEDWPYTRSWLCAHEGCALTASTSITTHPPQKTTHAISVPTLEPAERESLFDTALKHDLLLDAGVEIEVEPDREDRRIVIVLLGRAGAGKDTLAARLIEQHGFVRYAFADRVKALVREIDPICGWQIAPNSKAEPEPERLSDLVRELGNEEEVKRRGTEYRRILQRLAGGLRAINSNIWVNQVLPRVEADPRHVVITDCRYRNELEALRRLDDSSAVPTDVYTVRILRGQPQVGGHASEFELDLEVADFSVVNDGTLGGLYDVVDQVFQDICGFR